MAVDKRGLWVGYFASDQNGPNGLGQYNKKDWANCNQPGSLAGQNVNAIAFDRQGQVWVALENGGVARYDGHAWRSFTEREGLPSNQTYGITVDPQGRVWVATWEGLAMYDGDRWRTPYTFENKTLASNRVHALAFDSAGNIWVGYIREGISQYIAAENRWVYYHVDASAPSGRLVRSIVVRPRDDLLPESIWFATADGGVSAYVQGQWRVYRASEGLPSDDVRAVALDRYNRVWVATAAGVAYFDGKTWARYNSLPTLSLAFGSSCQGCPFDDDHVWAGTDSHGLTHSRIPLPGDVLDVIEVRYPKVVAPGEIFRPEIVVMPRSPYQLREDRGDFLSNMDSDDANLFGAYPIIPVKGIVEPGQPFTFVDPDDPFRAPPLAEGETERTFVSTWRVWMYTRYVGPPIEIRFTVRRAGSNVQRTLQMHRALPGDFVSSEILPRRRLTSVVDSASLYLAEAQVAMVTRAPLPRSPTTPSRDGGIVSRIFARNAFRPCAVVDS